MTEHLGNEDLWIAEREVTYIFKLLIDEIGYEEADLLFEEAGLNNDDYYPQDKMQKAIELLEKYVRPERIIYSEPCPEHFLDENRS